MIKLINHINMGYYKKLPKHVLTNTSIEQCEAKEIVSKSFASENLHLSVQAFQNTWFNSKQYLQKYGIFFYFIGHYLKIYYIFLSFFLLLSKT